MADRRSAFPNRSRFVGWAIAYALIIAYSSLIVGPRGFHFVPLDLDTAWRLYRETPFLENGSDQRADWMANLVMLVPLGFLATGALWPYRGRSLRWPAGAAALSCCLFLVMLLKYLQVFFPPRTVSLNYIVAQSLGALLGVTIFWRLYDGLDGLLRGISEHSRRSPMIICGIYTIVLLLFFLFPFDFVLSDEDLRERAAVLPRLLFSWPGEGRPTAVRVVLLLADTAATIPVGVFLFLQGRRRSLLRVAILGLLIMSGVTLLAMLVLSAAPSPMAIFYRTAGVVMGAALSMWFEGQDSARWRHLAARLVPLAVLPYVFAVVFANDFLSPRWRSLPEALAAVETSGLWPFYHHYIVSKAHAAASVAVHLLTYAPIGTMIALRRGSGRAGVWTAVVLAVLLSLTVELGRWLKPGLQPDFSNAIIAAIGAALAVKLTAVFWRLLEGGGERSDREPARSVRQPRT